MKTVRPNHASRFARRRGFTLIESAIVTVIIGVGAVALLELLAAGTTSNVSGAELTTGVNLAKQVRELSLQSVFNDTIAMNNKSFDPPLDAGNNQITKLAGWKQSIVVKSMNPDKLTQELVSADPDAVQVTVTVTHNGRRVCELKWHRFK